MDKKEAIRKDLKNIQSPINNYDIPEAIVSAKTGIIEVDEAILQLYKTGYMHNHMRMYVASICCNMANSHWLEPSKWMYSHLLDGDLASNFLSWQWVAGAFANKKYFANQDNINKYFLGKQKDTFLDVDYAAFKNFQTPEILNKTTRLDINLSLPNTVPLELIPHKKTLIYNYYNLDPYWYKGKDVQRILLIEPPIFKENPINQNCMDFAISLSLNIPNIQIFIGEFKAINQLVNSEDIIYKEHPLNSHYLGIEEPRDWMTTVKGYYPSFFAYWKKAKKEIHL